MEAPCSVYPTIGLNLNRNLHLNLASVAAEVTRRTSTADRGEGQGEEDSSFCLSSLDVHPRHQSARWAGPTLAEANGLGPNPPDGTRPERARQNTESKIQNEIGSLRYLL